MGSVRREAAMRIRIGEERRVPPSRVASQPGDFYALTRGSHQTGINPNRGIFNYASVRDPNGIHRVPAILLYTNNLRGLSENNPWLDIVDADDGYALYHGDNRTPGAPFFSTPGNQTILGVYEQYSTPELRALAPPMILFEGTTRPSVAGSFRRFVGYGIPRDLRIQSQRSSEGTFSNLAVEMVLFDLTSEDEQLDWTWIDQRREPSVTADEVLRFAPVAWQRWVEYGDSAVETSRRRVFGATIRSPAEQMAESSSTEHSLAKEIYDFFNSRSSAYAFEGLASWATSKILGSSSSRGWVTPRVDGGIDFVSRLDLGSGLARTAIVVLGQAKCIRPGTSVRGIDLARTVARLKRGWIGVVVTTGTFSVKAQQEVLADQYPLLLVNGTRLAQEVHEEIARTGLKLEEVLRREVAWYEANQRTLVADRVAFGDHWGDPVSPGG